MAIIAGIDEAGFGPLLGPLVISAAAMRVPDERIADHLWDTLHRSISQTRKKIAGRLLVCDSKKAHTKAAGNKHLLRTTLSFLKVSGYEPQTLKQLLNILTTNDHERLADYPWYRSIADHKLDIDPLELGIAANVLKLDLQKNNLDLLDIKSKCLDVGYYNKLVTNTKNKSKVAFTAVCQLINNLTETYPDEQLQIIIDRQGGRTHYSRPLMLMFEGIDLTVLKETPNISSYELNDCHRKIKLHFIVKADAHHALVSLASITSKLVRELMMENINNYFCQIHPDLKPTAGYWQDGQRYITEINEYKPRIDYDKQKLIRTR